MITFCDKHKNKNDLLTGVIGSLNQNSRTRSVRFMNESFRVGL